LVLVERQDLETVLDEIGFQYTGHLDDETTIRLGRLTGADSLLIYRSIVQETGPHTGAFELRLLKVESGTTVFRQMTSARHSPLVAASQPVGFSTNAGIREQHLVLEQTAAYGLAALTAAFGDNPLGLVYDYGWTGNGIRVLDVLQGGPGFRAGIRPADEILQSNHVPVRHWTDPLSLPAHLTVNRQGLPLEITVP
jgi:hypothetical protein